MPRHTHRLHQHIQRRVLIPIAPAALNRPGEVLLGIELLSPRHIRTLESKIPSVKSPLPLRSPSKEAVILTRSVRISVFAFLLPTPYSLFPSTLEPMQEARPSRTALRVALRRASHQLYDAP